MYDEQRLIELLSKLKDEYEDAIEDPDEKPTYVIRRQDLIENIHDFVKEQLVENGINEDKVKKDKTVYGYPKKKSQDIVVVNNEDNIETGPLMSVNIRSQLSSVAKNVDTINERIFAESTNLHNRFQLMPLGYLFIVPLRGYDVEAKRENRVEYGEEYELEKFIDLYQAISGRDSNTDEEYKYEALSLLIVDMEGEKPEILESIQEIADRGRVSDDYAEYYDREFEKDEQIINLENFFDSLMSSYHKNYARMGYHTSG